MAAVTCITRRNVSTTCGSHLRAGAAAAHLETRFASADRVPEHARVGHTDSALAIRGEGRTILNLNDCDTPAVTLRGLARKMGHVDLLLDQFSVAGWHGKASCYASYVSLSFRAAPLPALWMKSRWKRIASSVRELTD